jgi:hypothetical protein
MTERMPRIFFEKKACLIRRIGYNCFRESLFQVFVSLAGPQTAAGEFAG